MYRNLTKSKIYLINCVIALLLILGITNDLISRKAGITLQTSGGCGVSGSCHLGSADAATGINISNNTGSFNMYTSASINITIRVTHASQPKGGINFGVKSSSSGGSDVGTISNIGAGLKQVVIEVTHDNPVTYTSGGYDYTFTWTAPSTPGTYYLQVSANSVNDNGKSDGDIWNSAVQTIVVTQGPTLSIISPNGGENICPGSSTNIVWNATGFTSAKIDLSSDGGSTYQTNLTTIPASTGTYAWNVPANQTVGNQYKIKISDANNSAYFKESNTNFAIATSTAIATQPLSKSMCTGISNSLSLTAIGNNLSYIWKKNGSEIAGAISSTLIFPSVTSFDVGNYNCTVYGACGNPIISSPAIVSILNSPKILTQPLSGNVCIGSFKDVWVEASGDNLTYKWQKDGIDIAGANSKTLSIFNFQNSNSGSYKFFAISSNCSSTVISNVAVLQSASSPTITIQPTNLNLCENSDCTISLTSTGTNLTYQWFQNGLAVPNSNSQSLTFTKISQAKAGNYYCKIAGTCDPIVTSSTISLNVNSAPVISLNPISKTVPEGGSFTFTVASSSTSTPLTYQWFKGTTLLAAKTNQNLELTNLTSADSGEYFCKLSNTCGTISSNSATLNVSSGANGILTLANNSIIFGEVLQSKTDEKQITNFISNTGKKALKITSVNFKGTNKDNFSIKVLTLPLTLDVGKTQDVRFVFTAGTRGLNTATAEIVTEDNQTATVLLIGKSAIEKPFITLNKIDFSLNPILNVLTSTTISLTNTSGIPEVFTNPITLSDNNFSVSSPSGSFIVEANKSQNLIVDFTPKVESSFSCTISMKAEYAINTVKAYISGKVSKNSVEYDENIIDNIISQPNPINSNAEISFDIPIPQQFEFKISDLQGRIVKSFIEPNITSGHYLIKWDGNDSNATPLENGIYYGVFQSGNKIKTIILTIKK